MASGILVHRVEAGHTATDFILTADERARPTVPVKQTRRRVCWE
jgi:hypothetical protein